jgi:hypothetical protein
MPRVIGIVSKTHDAGDLLIGACGAERLTAEHRAPVLYLESGDRHESPLSAAWPMLPKPLRQMRRF